MPVQATSLAAYDSVALGARQAEVLAAITELGECTDQQIADRLGWTINRVTPRRGELEEAGLVIRTAVRPGPTGRKVSVWRITPRQLRLDLTATARASQ